MKEANDRTKSNENLFSTQNSYADKINKIRLDNRQYGIPYNPSILQLKSQMNILPKKPTTIIKKLNPDLNYKVVGILISIIAILGLCSFFITFSIKNNIKMNDNKLNAVYSKNKDNSDIRIFNEELFSQKLFIKYINNNTPLGINDYSNLTKVEIILSPAMKNIDYMFSGCTNLLSIEINFTSTNLVNMSHTFENCTNLQEINFISFNSSKIISMDSLFKGCKNLSNIKGIENLNTSLLNNIDNIFDGCENLVKIDLSSFNLDNIKNKRNVFGLNNPKLNEIILNFTHNENENDINNTIYNTINFGLHNKNFKIIINNNKGHYKNYSRSDIYNIIKQKRNSNI